MSWVKFSPSWVKIGLIQVLPVCTTQWKKTATNSSTCRHVPLARLGIPRVIWRVLFRIKCRYLMGRCCLIQALWSVHSIGKIVIKTCVFQRCQFSEFIRNSEFLAIKKKKIRISKEKKKFLINYYYFFGDKICRKLYKMAKKEKIRVGWPR